ncbi:MAG: hypothetical protein GYA50_06250 [Eubacteriaceae bacterium]|nr:hypothetical protein [Eubacteriaceae bacterium]
MSFKSGFVLIFDNYFYIIADDGSDDTMKIINYIDFKETKNKFIIYYGTGYGIGTTYRYGLEAIFNYNMSIFNIYAISKNNYVQYIKENFKSTPSGVHIDFTSH